MAAQSAIRQFSLQTQGRQQFVDITGQVSRIVADSGVEQGLAVVFTPHTTAGVTINENADPDVLHDLALILDKLSPQLAGLRHSEGNSPAHAKSSLVGCSLTLLIDDCRPRLGTWQGVYFCEFDGPRSRQVWVKVVPG